MSERETELTTVPVDRYTQLEAVASANPRPEVSAESGDVDVCRVEGLARALNEVIFYGAK